MSSFLELLFCPLRMTRWSLLLQTPSSSYTTSWDSTEAYLLSTARKLLGDGYHYEEIRVVRMHLRQRG